MRKTLVLVLALAASFSVSAQQQANPPAQRSEANPQQQGGQQPQGNQQPQANQQPQISKEEMERLRVDGVAGGTRPVPPEERQAIGAGAGPHRRFNQPSPERLPGGEPIDPEK